MFVKRASLLAILVTTFLIAAITHFLVAAVTNGWLEGSFEWPFEATSSHQLHLRLSMGLRETCIEETFTSDTFTPVTSRTCWTVDQLDEEEREKMIESHKDITHVWICMCMTLVTAGLALLISLPYRAAPYLKMPRNVRDKQSILLAITTVLCIVAAIFGLTAIIIASEKIHGEADFIREGIKEEEMPAEESSSVGNVAGTTTTGIVAFTPVHVNNTDINSWASWREEKRRKRIARRRNQNKNSAASSTLQSSSERSRTQDNSQLRNNNIDESQQQQSAASSAESIMAGLIDRAAPTFAKGTSFRVACIGEIFLIVAAVLAIHEGLQLRQASFDADYGGTLLAPGERFQTLHGAPADSFQTLHRVQIEDSGSSGESLVGSEEQIAGDAVTNPC